MTILSKTNDIIAWEQGTLSDEKTVELFQFLLDEGHCWRLQGFYGRFAEHLLQQGVILSETKTTISSNQITLIIVTRTMYT
jgi:hypothetical protein